MTPIMFYITIASLAGLSIIAVCRLIAYKNAGSFAVQVIILASGFFLLFRFFHIPDNIVPKGDGAGIYFVIILYFFMLLGMLASYAYAHLSLPKKERKEKEFDWGLFIAPVLASPIVFIPLLAAFQNENIDLKNLTTAKMMIFLVAFQNGFFWKEYFDNLRKEKEKGENVQKVSA